MEFTVKKKEHLYEKKTLIVGVFKEDTSYNETILEMDRQMDGSLMDMIKDKDIRSDSKKVSTIHTLGKLPIKRIYFVGLGYKDQYSVDIAREAFGRVCQKVQGDGHQEVSVVLDTFIQSEIDEVKIAQLLGEAATLSTYRIVHYKKSETGEEVSNLKKVQVDTNGEHKAISANIKVGSLYGTGANKARTLVNMPGNILTPTKMAEEAISIAQQYGLQYDILEKDQMESLGMGALLAVNKGSEEPPKMIILKYQGKKNWEDVIALVGKGITFDTGGYSLKSKDSIVEMKTDMGGAASVLGAMEIIAQIKPEQNVLAVIPSTDNMISGGAMKPDDVITSMSGKTIEVLNTDAEGRLALADGITYAKQNGAKYIIDVATLTGGVVVALGNETTGTMTNDQELLQSVEKASENCGEPIWQLPIPPKHKERVCKSKVADLNNSPGRDGHAIFAAAFLQEFVEKTPWVHLDIAGTAMKKQADDLGPSGATGVMSRTLANFIENFSE
ncbi:leucyl aminopeptidase [Bacillus carboniphilus]|uniref:Probable cytosol aminopeptidase n=1 Tax=Bacillus carboniphilus TaxID=86663 RepID=A0ABY9JR39_9BACI|nr:leucyl aminopeptidase [Bacillus carboniphilus]WLR41279.1 leucyl aminopeptidase [Bacillus carboniphilus]